MKSSIRRRSFVSLFAALAVLAGLFIAPTQSASALGCVLGPSLAAAAKAAGVSCPDVEGSGGAGEHWGATGSACKYGWRADQLPDGLLDFFTGSSRYSESVTFSTGEKVTRTYFRRGGHTIGQIGIRTFPDHTFALAISAYERTVYRNEYAYFDCMTSSDGAIYEAEGRRTNLIPMPGSDSPTVPGEVTGLVQTRGSMSALADNKYLLRIDVTSVDSTSTFADVFLGLEGYSVDGFPSLPPSVGCEPTEGLSCTVDTLLPGQTVSMVLLLTASGDPDDTASVDVEVSSMGLKKIKTSISRAAVKKRVLVTDSYEVVRP